MTNCHGLFNFVWSQFSNNHASGGGVAYGGIATIVVDNSHFVNNKAQTKGGAFSSRCLNRKWAPPAERTYYNHTGKIGVD